MRLLVDTHAFLWAIKDYRELSAVAQAALKESEYSYLSSISVWEINVKYHLGKLDLEENPSVCIPEQRQLHGIAPLAFEEADAFQLAKLPPIHKDPFDRMLIAQAISHNLTILTSDRAITQYPVATIW